MVVNFIKNNEIFIIYNKKTLVSGWKDGRVDGRESGVKDCLQQSKIGFKDQFLQQSCNRSTPVLLNLKS